MDKTLILNKLKKHFNFKNDSDFADFLGVKQNTLSAWKNRNTFDFEKIITKCNDLKSLLIVTDKEEELHYLLNNKNNLIPKESISDSETTLYLKQLIESQKETIESLKETIDTQKQIIIAFNNKIISSEHFTYISGRKPNDAYEEILERFKPQKK